MKKNFFISIAFVCIVLGIMISTQFKNVKNSDNLTVQRAEELTNKLKQVQKERDELKNQINDLESKISSYENSAAKTSTVTKSLKDDLDKYKELAGLSDVEGPGVIVTINDSDKQLQPGDDQNSFLVHDEDLLNIVNELRAAGAEAISINDQRLVATSEIRMIGTTMNINSARFTAPYVVKAIGNPDTLEAALKLKGGIVDTLLNWGIQVSIKRSDKLLVKKYDGVLTYKYAKPYEGGNN
ncbi:MAG: hypothetical protein PWQ59_133 [Thermoanaerobacterium sp.]|uniref:DUF881 domain-containing protein n=1 Tax=Thermoanaerobacterium sp. CMT5567-10 TaxID=3061989 RepID=UPI0024ABCEDD|nr:DUF881 domain-containing protein [Thermoanaerobacterium sp. CMT5567-10]MDI3476608.1 hypothetical protein [Thermoanaerobacterium sp.]MDN5317193.1 hypothetical protein [Thermoanaerobacterium sp.]WKV09376.1 DUF881 domain-containing protein [Thermoanaerobacterium sp. CMT5567-10]